MFDKDFDKSMNLIIWASVVGAIASVILSLGVIGVIIWAIIKLVTHFS